MSDEPTKQQATEQSPSSYWVGEELNWEADPVPVILFVELPFWLMVSDCSLAWTWIGLMVSCMLSSIRSA